MGRVDAFVVKRKEEGGNDDLDLEFCEAHSCAWMKARTPAKKLLVSSSLLVDKKAVRVELVRIRVNFAAVVGQA